MISITLKGKYFIWRWQLVRKSFSRGLKKFLLSNLAVHAEYGPITCRAELEVFVVPIYVFNLPHSRPLSHETRVKIASLFFLTHGNNKVC